MIEKIILQRDKKDWTNKSVLAIDEKGNAKPLKHHVYHSPDGFEWGYGGSGPADLSRSILLETIGSDRDYQDFKRRVIAGIPNEGGIITRDDIAEFLLEIYPEEIVDEMMAKKI